MSKSSFGKLLDFMEGSFDDSWDIRLTPLDLTKNGVECLAHVGDMNCFERGAGAILLKEQTRYRPWRRFGAIPRQVIRIVENYFRLTRPGDICLGANRSRGPLN